MASDSAVSTLVSAAQSEPMLIGMASDFAVSTVSKASPIITPSTPEDIREIVVSEVMNLIQATVKSVEKEATEVDVDQEAEAIDIDKDRELVLDEEPLLEKEPTADEEPVLEQANYEALIHETKEEIKDLSIENKVLQRRLLALQKRRSTIGTKLFLEGAETQYEIVAREARHVRSGRRLSKSLLDEFHNEHNEADVEIERLRIEGRQLTSHLKKIQQAILKKNRLPGNLFAVDFEQQKIENESLHERLSKKTKELEDLKQETTHIIHVLTHSREKLQFVQKKIEGDAHALENLEVELTKAHSELQRINIKCEKLQLKKAKLQNTIIVRKPSLLDDMEASKEEVEASEKKLKELKEHYNSVVKQIQQKQQLIEHSVNFYEMHDQRQGMRRKVLTAT